jgi:hypothetical protein
MLFNDFIMLIIVFTLYIPLCLYILQGSYLHQPGACMFVCCECCVLSGRGLCDGFDRSSRGVLPTVARRCV